MLSDHITETINSRNFLELIGVKHCLRTVWGLGERIMPWELVRENRSTNNTGMTMQTFGRSAAFTQGMSKTSHEDELSQDLDNQREGAVVLNGDMASKAGGWQSPWAKVSGQSSVRPSPTHTLLPWRWDWTQCLGIHWLPHYMGSMLILLGDLL